MMDSLKCLWESIFKYKEAFNIWAAIATIGTAIVLILFKPWRLIMSLYEYYKYKKEEKHIYKSVKKEILQCKKNPEYEIEVSLRSLCEKYPFEEPKMLIKVIKRLHKNNLFDGGDINKLFFFYKGNINGSKNEPKL